MKSADTSGASSAPHEARADCDDHTLVEGIKAGQEHLFATLMRRHNQRLFRAARSILPEDRLAEDAVQEAYVAAYYALGSYKPHGSFAAWLSQITINEARMIRRKRKRDTETPLEEIEDSPYAADPDRQANPDHGAANLGLARLLETEIAGLPENFRLVFVMRGVQQLSVEETAQTLRLPAATVKTRYHRARKLLQKALAPYIEQAGLNIYEFAGQRCDHMVATVMRRLRIEH